MPSSVWLSGVCLALALFQPLEYIALHAGSLPSPPPPAMLWLGFLVWYLPPPLARLGWLLWALVFPPPHVRLAGQDCRYLICMTKVLPVFVLLVLWFLSPWLRVGSMHLSITAPAALVT